MIFISLSENKKRFFLFHWLAAVARLCHFWSKQKWELPHFSQSTWHVLVGGAGGVHAGTSGIHDQGVWELWLSLESLGFFSLPSFSCIRIALCEWKSRGRDVVAEPLMMRLQVSGHAVLVPNDASLACGWEGFSWPKSSKCIQAVFKDLGSTSYFPGRTDTFGWPGMDQEVISFPASPPLHLILR